MKRVLFTASVMSHIAQFHKPAIQLLQANGYEVHVAARDNLSEKSQLNLDFVDQSFDIEFDRQPFRRSNVRAFRHLRQVIKEGAYDLVHCNTPLVGILTRMASAPDRRQRRMRVIYTAHGFHFYKGAPILNWIVYFPAEWLAAKLTDVLVTINSEDWKRSKVLPVRDRRYIPGVGVDVSRFRANPAEASYLRDELGLGANAFVILSIGELNSNKNHASILRALADLGDDRVHYVVCGNGPLESRLEHAARELGIEGNVWLLGYRRDIPELLQGADVFCFPSYREGLPMSLLEAMSAELPVVASKIRGVKDLVKSTSQGVLVFPANNVAQYSLAFRYLRDNPEIRSRMGAENRKRAEAFSEAVVLEHLADIYGIELGAKDWR